MPDYSVERQGPGRREADYTGHCDMHSHNSLVIETHTSSLVKLETGVNMLKWLVGLSVPIILGLWGVSYNTAAENQKAVQADLKDIKSITSTVPTEIRYLRENIDDIRGHVK
jgi:hypothetical protein